MDLHPTLKKIKMHNAGRVRSSKRYRPYDIIYFEIFATRSEAVNREYYFKTIEGYKYLKEKELLKLERWVSG